jgi:hypothetical protein
MTAVPAPLPMPVWQEDSTVQAILDGIETCQQKAQDLSKAMTDFEPVLYEKLQWLLDKTFGLAAPYVGEVVLAWEGLKRGLPPALQAVHDFLKDLRAPAKIIALGEYLVGEPLNHLNDLKNATNKSSLASPMSWSGDGADAFYTVAGNHEKAIADMAGVLTPVTSAILDFGIATRSACLGVLVGIAGVLVELIVGIAALTPPFTLGGILLIGGGVAALIGTIAVAVNYFNEQSKTQAEALKATVARYGVWPRGGGDDKESAQNMSDGTVKDGDASWSRK